MPNVIHFEAFEVDLEAGQLRKRGIRIKLRDQSFQVLAALLQHPGRLVTREELRRLLWHDDVFVDFDNNLNIVVGRLREALSDSADRPRFIETLPKRGYRFLADVRATDRTEESRDHGHTSPAKSLAAYKEYFEARRIMDSGRPAKLNLAKVQMEKALVLDPELADAHDAVAECCWQLGYAGYLRPKQAFSAGIMHAVRALEIDPGRAETHALLGQFHKIREYNWGEVEREMALALDLNPNSPVVRTRYAVSGLMPHGRVSEAAFELERALEIDPLSLFARGWLCIMLVLRRCFDRAIEEARKILDLDPDSFFGHFVLATCFTYQGKFDQAIAEHRKTVELLGDCHGTIGWLGLTLALSGRTSEARDLLQSLEEQRATEYVPASSLAWIHFGLRQIDAAFEWMNRAIEECDQYMMPIKTYGFLDSVRSDPRYTALLQKMNLS